MISKPIYHSGKRPELIKRVYNFKLVQCPGIAKHDERLHQVKP